jgi:hypothetical protein
MSDCIAFFIYRKAYEINNFNLNMLILDIYNLQIIPNSAPFIIKSKNSFSSDPSIYMIKSSHLSLERING